MCATENLPETMETRAIKRYIHKVVMIFHGMLHITVAPNMNILSHAHLRKVAKKHPLLSLTKAVFGKSLLVMVGILSCYLLPS